MLRSAFPCPALLRLQSRRVQVKNPTGGVPHGQAVPLRNSQKRPPQRRLAENRRRRRHLRPSPLRRRGTRPAGTAPAQATFPRGRLIQPPPPSLRPLTPTPAFLPVRARRAPPHPAGLRSPWRAPGDGGGGDGDAPGFPTAEPGAPPSAASARDWAESLQLSGEPAPLPLPWGVSWGRGGGWLAGRDSEYELRRERGKEERGGWAGVGISPVLGRSDRGLWIAGWGGKKRPTGWSLRRCPHPSEDLWVGGLGGRLGGGGGRLPSWRRTGRGRAWHWVGATGEASVYFCPRWMGRGQWHWKVWGGEALILSIIIIGRSSSVGPSGGGDLLTDPLLWGASAGENLSLNDLGREDRAERFRVGLYWTYTVQQDNQDMVGHSRSQNTLDPTGSEKLHFLKTTVVGRIHSS